MFINYFIYLLILCIIIITGKRKEKSLYESEKDLEIVAVLVNKISNSRGRQFEEKSIILGCK